MAKWGLPGRDLGTPEGAGAGSDGLRGWLTDWLLGHGRSIERVSLGELRRAWLALGREEERLAGEARRLRMLEQLLLGDYQQAQANGDQVKLAFVARRFQDLEAAERTLSLDHQWVLKESRKISGLIGIKEREEGLRRLGHERVLQMDLNDLHRYVEEAVESGEVNTERLDQVLQLMERRDLSRQRAQVASQAAALDRLALRIQQGQAVHGTTGEVPGDAALQRELEAVEARLRQGQAVPMAGTRGAKEQGGAR